MAYVHIPDALKQVWAADATLNAAIPATGDPSTNRFFSDGVEHLTLSQLDSLGPAYLVVNDLGYAGSNLRGPNITGLVWPFRLRIYHDLEATAVSLATTYFGGRAASGALRSDLGEGFDTDIARVNCFELLGGNLSRSNRLWFWQQAIQFRGVTHG